MRKVSLSTGFYSTTYGFMEIEIEMMGRCEYIYMISSGFHGNSLTRTQGHGYVGPCLILL